MQSLIELPKGLVAGDFRCRGLLFTKAMQETAWRQVLASQGWSAFPAGLLHKFLAQGFTGAGLSQEERGRLKEAAARGADRMLQSAREAGLIVHDGKIHGWRWVSSER